MNIAYLLIGGNLGNREEYLQTAEELILKHCGTLLKKSAVYETAAWGNTNQPAFLNQVLMIKTELNARQLIRRILKIEKSMGRIRQEKGGPRLIDIDILFYNKEIFNLRFLTIPHPEIQNRRFVLQPLADIEPELVHPILKKTISDLLLQCIDKLPVNKYA